MSALTGRDGAGSGSVVITGASGVGKTVLARDAVCGLPGAVVVAGAGLPMATVSVPFLPLRSMFRSLEPAMAIDFDAPPARVLMAVDHAIDELSEHSRTAVIVDDLQWVDSATLDVLLYLIAGAADRSVSIIATVRDDPPGDVRPVDRWLANVERMPRAEIVALEPLDRAGTEDQIAATLGTRPHQSLVQDVWTHTHGFPYLTALIVAGLDSGATHLPESLPRDLVDAVDLSTRRLDPDVVSLLRVMAVSGRPLAPDQLSAVLEVGDPSVEPRPGTVEELLLAATRGGTLVQTAEGGYWFQHPLAAEVLERQLSEAERESWHAVFVRVGERADLDAAGYEVIGRIADHALRSGRPADAYRWCLIAYRRASDAGAHAQALRWVESALALRPSLDHAHDSELTLLRARRSAAKACGAIEEEVDAIDRLLAQDVAASGPERSELVARRMLLLIALQHAPPGEDDVTALLALTAGHESSWQHAHALALATMWTRDEAVARARLTEALERAERSGNDTAQAWSQAVAVDFAMLTGDSATACELGPRAIASALKVRDGLAHNFALQAMAAAESGGEIGGFAETLRIHRERALEFVPHVYLSWLAAQEADSWLQLGRWAECAAALRFTIGEYPGRIVDMHVRATAGRLATRQGRLDDAEGHFARLAELYTEDGTYLWVMHLGQAELMLERGDPLGAARALAPAGDRALEADRHELRFVAMRTIADARSGAGDSIAAHVDALIGHLAFPLDDPESPRWADQTGPAQRETLRRLRIAEQARVEGAEDAPTLWIQAADACRGVLAWEEAYACRRAAEAVLLTRRPDRAAAAPILRRGLEVAERLGAVPLARALRDLARFARIPVPDGEGSDEASIPESAPPIEGLTSREAEIVDLVVAGRTYREIADELYVSEKTVSSHISNILRKTGAANRVDLARLATAVRNPTSG